MIDTAVSSVSLDSVEDVLRAELANGDTVASSVVPILRHLLASDDHSVFTDDIIARVRGMLNHIAGQLLDRLHAVEQPDCRIEHEADEVQGLTDAFVENGALLRHVHSLAIEWQLTERMQSRLAIDPVLPPLIQAQIASSSPDRSSLAMRLLASQARFGQFQRRMMLPIEELPGDLLHAVLLSMRTLAGTETEADARAAAAETAIRTAYHEGSNRLSLLSQLVTGMGGEAISALSVSHAGVAAFLTALAIGSGQDRETAILSTNEAQLARLALALRSAGLKPANVEEQFLALHPDVSLPDGFERLGADHAAAILALGHGSSGG